MPSPPAVPMFGWPSLPGVGSGAIWTFLRGAHSDGRVTAICRQDCGVRRTAFPGTSQGVKHRRHRACPGQTAAWRRRHPGALTGMCGHRCRSSPRWP